MRKLFLIGIIVSFFGSCSTEDNQIQNSSSCKVTSIKLWTLFFDDFGFWDFVIPPNVSGKLYFDYDLQGRIVKTRGGFIKNIPGQNVADFIFTEDAFDTITYQGNKVTVQYSANYPDARSKKQFTFASNGNPISVNVKGNNFNVPFEIDYTYVYSANQVEEKLNGNINRRFFLENDNLVKVEQFYYTSTNIVFRKEETFFSNYDDSANLLKGKFFINGNFCKAFSKNNYKKVSWQFWRLYEGEFISAGEGYVYPEITYDSNGNADLFEYENCN